MEIQGSAHTRKGCVALGQLRPRTRLLVGARAIVRLLHACFCPQAQSWHHQEPGLAFGILPNFLPETEALLSLNASFLLMVSAQLSRANVFFADVANSRVIN